MRPWLALLVLVFIPSALGAETMSVSVSTGSCQPGERPTRDYSGWPSKSHAICDYDDIELNRRLLTLLDVPAGASTVEILQEILDTPAFIKRDEWQPNGFYSTKDAHFIILVGKNGWDGVIQTYLTRWDGDKRSNFKMQVMTAAPMMLPQAKDTGCLTEAVVLDQAIALGWRYVPGTMESGTAGPIFMPGALVNDKGQTLKLVNLSNSLELPPRDKLEAVCAQLFSFDDNQDYRKQKG